MLIVGLTVAAIALRRSTLLARGGDRMSAMIVVGAAGVVASPVSWTHHQVWLVMAAMLPVRCRSVRARWAWAVAVLAVMILPVTTFALLVPGPLGLLLRNARLLTAILIACVVPLAVTDNHVPSPHLRRRARASSRPPELAAYGTNGPDPPGAGFRSL
jgi:alpha-1,2-mannosyltransferase